jgi:hypothetical protein
MSLKGTTLTSCLLAIGILLVTSFALPANAHTDYADVYPPNSASTSVVGINDIGDIVGNYDIGGSQFGFIDDNNSYTTIDVPNSITTQVTGINNSGEVVGSYFNGNTWLGFIDQGGNYTTVNVPDSTSTFINGINSSGELVGSYGYDWGPNSPVFTSIDFSYAAGNYTTNILPPDTYVLGDSAAINNAGVVAGTYLDGSRTYGSFIEDGGNYTSVRGLVAGINSAGEMAGNYDLNDPKSGMGFFDNNGAYQDIDVPGSTNTVVTGLNDSGQVVGYYDTGSSEFGFVEDGGSYATFDPPGSVSSQCVAINSTGVIVGAYFNGVTDVGFVSAPELPSVVLFALSLSGFLFVIGWRKIKG